MRWIFRATWRVPSIGRPGSALAARSALWTRFPRTVTLQSCQPSECPCVFIARAKSSSENHCLLKLSPKKKCCCKSFWQASHAAFLRARRRLHTARNGVKLREDEAYITTRRMHASKVKKEESIDRDEIRTHNLLLRRQTPYPLGHRTPSK